MRRQAFQRQLLQETRLQASDLIYPMFVIEGHHLREAIPSMPGIERLSLDLLIEDAKRVQDLGIPAIALFPVIPLAERNPAGSSAYDPQGLLARSIRALKQACPNLGVIADVALDPYTSHGQDGLINEQGYVLNDATVASLVKQALCYAEAGVDILAPSDMMDGRIKCIREALEAQGFVDTCILAYTAKYASHYYGPFRDALGTQNLLSKGSKVTYQMDPANQEEALREAALDIQEGADLIMVKPALPYLDIIAQLKQRFQHPVFAYQVSGEYAMQQLAINQGLFEPKGLILESLLCIKRAGASAILSYHAKTAAAWCQN